MEIIINKIGEQTTITINGRLDTPNAQVFEDKIQIIRQDKESDVCIDCNAEVKEVFDMTGFSGIVNL